MIEAAWIAFAFLLGLGARAVNLPPLVGYLAAGFVLTALGNRIGVGPLDSEILAHLAQLGVLLLLFTVGLKLKLGNLVRPEVIGGGIMHFAISVTVFLPGLLWLAELPLREACCSPLPCHFPVRCWRQKSWKPSVN